MIEPRDTTPVCRFARQAMACTWEVFIEGQNPTYARQAAEAAFAEVARLEQELSRFVLHSDIARLNSSPPGVPLRLGVDAWECLELAARFHAETHGAFDVTVGALVRPPAGESSVPPPVGMHLLELDRSARSVTVRAPGLIVDLGGIGKGLAVDRVAGILRDWRVSAALVHAGQSTVYALGRPADQLGWNVAVRDPANYSASLGHLCLCDRALSGSGLLLHGEHIIDPRTRRPAAGQLAAWTLAPSAAASDALSTAFMVLTPAEVGQYCESHRDISALLALRTGAGYVLRRHGEAFAHL